MRQIVIRTRDISVLLDVSQRTAQRKMRVIRQELQKKPDQLISVREFARWVNIEESEVYAAMRKGSSIDEEEDRDTRILANDKPHPARLTRVSEN